MRERAVRLVREHEGDHASRAAAVRSVAEKVGCHRETLRLWLRQAERDDGVRPGPTSEERDRIRQLERENCELRQANEILRKGEPVKAPLVQAHWRTRILRRRSSTAH
jgi:transposase-like protein